MNDKLIIDVREPQEFALGHVKGALNIPSASLMAGFPELESIPKDTQLILYCKTGSRSALAIILLKQKGFTNLINGMNKEQVSKNYL